MAVKYPITLSVSEPNNNIGLLKVRQADEESQTLVVQILEDAVPKSYEGLQVFFCARIGQTAGLGIIEQKLNPEEMTDPKNGKLEYTLRAEDWQVLGRQNAYFSFRKMTDDHTFVQQFSTRDFTYEVTKSIYSDGIKEVTRDGSTYVWTFEDLLRLLEEFKESGETDFLAWYEEIKDQLSEDAAGNLMILYQSLRDKTGKDTDFRDFESDKSFMKRVFNESKERGINAKWFGAAGDGITDDTQAIKNLFSVALQNNCSVWFPNGRYAVSETIAVENFGNDICGDNATIKALANTQIEKLFYLKNCNNIRINLNFDASQTDATLAEDPKTDICLYIENSRKITLDGNLFSGCKIGRPFVIYGTSSNNPDFDTEGCVDIFINDVVIDGIHYDVVDEGCYAVIKSDFYTVDDSKYLYGSNGLKIADMQLDESVSFRPTTRNVFIKNFVAKNCDRIAVLNVDGFYVDGFSLENFYTRGFNLSPCVTNFSIKNGTVEGGDATQLACNAATKNGVFENITLIPLRPAGEKTSCKAYRGCENIVFRNIKGQANFERAIYLVQVKNILFDNVSLVHNGVSALNAIELSADFTDGVGQTTYDTSNVVIKNSTIESNTGIVFNPVVGNCKIATGGFVIENSKFVSKNSGGMFNEQKSGLAKATGNISMSKTEFVGNGSVNPVYDSKLFCVFEANRGVFSQMIQQITTATVQTYHTFDKVFYYVDKLGNGSSALDNLRNPDVQILRDGMPLVYGLDWFCDSTLTADIMTNRIRCVRNDTFPVGSVLTIVRLR